MTDSRTRAIVLHIEFKSRTASRDGRIATPRTPEAKLEEARGLAEAVGVEVLEALIVSLAVIHPRALLGEGKVRSLGEQVRNRDAELVIVNAQLSAVQQRNLERAWNAKVLDRTALILEIFGERAQTREGSLQVELAHLQYQKSRLVRSWTHLERQRGGFGFLGGPGESQLEIDRRLIQQRISRIENELDSVKRTRSLHRQSRARVPYPVVALVGYTNAGKSTLFNRLTKSSVTAQDLLFATLDPTMREVELLHGRKIILSDTVGFISDLPTMLVAAFRATLEEVLTADLILHVRDISHEDSEAQSEDVERVLADLGLDEIQRRRMIEVWNKADAIADEETHRALMGLAKRREGTVLVSALTGQGIDSLLSLIEERLAVASLTFEIELGPEEGHEVSWLYSRGEVLKRSDDEQGLAHLTVRFDPAVAPIAQSRFGERLKAASPHLRAAAE
ncbi:MAG TPA: GTPase HflX [Aestuariivirgaceae bacterium]|jgi:GTP-binding protein HflX